MKISDREIRGTLALAAILLIAMLLIWTCSPSSYRDRRNHDIVLFPEDSLTQTTDSTKSPVRNVTEESRTVVSDKENNRKDRRQKGTGSRKRNAGTPRRTAPGHSDRPSPLDSPVK